MEKSKRNTFTGSIGFVLAAAGSAVGLGNIWRFPYLAARDGGGIFLVVYIALALTFGFTLVTTEIAIGRKTKLGPLPAYGKLHGKFRYIGFLACLVPAIIMPYYCVICGWVIKYCLVYLTGKASEAAEDTYFTSFITDRWEPMILMVVFLVLVAVIIIRGVNKGIEALSKVLMPALFILVFGIAIFSLTISNTDENGVVRTGLQGLAIYCIPDFTGMTFSSFISVALDAMGQLFYSLSVAMGILIAYGSYMPDEVDMNKSVIQIEICDTLVAFLAGVMIIPAVYSFMGREGMESSGPGLMFVLLPRVFSQMGKVGRVVGFLFFAMVFFAALTSAISIMEAVISSFMDEFKMSRIKAVILESIITLILGIIVCLGYNSLYFEYTLPTGSVGQILDIMDYVSNNLLMPIVAISTCILIGWFVKPDMVIEECEKTGHKLRRQKMYRVMVKYVAPVLLLILLLRSVGII